MKNIQIKNYKMLDNLTIEDFTKINIFVGENNVGKSSVLEAIYLNYCASKLLNTLNNISYVKRNKKIKQESLLGYFHDLDETKKIDIKSNIGTVNISSIISNIYVDGPIDLKQNKKYYLPPREEVVGMEATITSNGKYEGISKFKYFNDDEYNLKIEYKDIEDSNVYECIYIDSNNIPIVNEVLKSCIGIMRYNKKEHEFVKYLKLFNENINDIEWLGDDLYVCVDNLRKRVDCSTLGSGFNNYIAILAIMLYGGYRCYNEYTYIHKPYKVVCIDNIDNGLHYETVHKLISSIIDIVKNQDTQLFITSHSYEFFTILLDICHKLKFNDVNVYNIHKTKLKGMQAYKYPLEYIKTYLKNKTEFRD